MNAKPKKLAVTLTITAILLTSALANMNIGFSNGTNGNIDLFTQKEPYSGKGSNVQSDAFAPREEVKIYALATYNEYPVERLLVAFEILGPENPIENITFYRAAFTNETGVATISFRILNLNETTFGEWTVLGNVKIDDVIHEDSVIFKVGWIVELVSLRTMNEQYIEQEEFLRESYLGIELVLRNIAMTEKIATLTLTMYDQLNTFVNATELSDFAVKPNGTLNYAYLFLYIPKSAYIGRATVYACAYATSPEPSWVPYCPEVSKYFSITSRAYFLKVKTEPTGIVTIPGEGWYDGFSSVNLTAPYMISVSTGVRYRFSYWDVDSTSRDVEINSINVFMDTNHTATAHYIRQYYLTVKTDPLGITAVLGEGWYDESANVTISAPAVSGYNFEYWDANGASQASGVISLTVHMNAPRTATAHYTQIIQIIAYTLTITATEGGTTNPAPRTYNYAASSTVQVTALPNANYIFSHWELDNVNVSSANPYTVTMDQNHTLKAVFSKAIAGWFVPDWFHWFLLPLSILLIVLLIILFYHRKRKEKAEEAFYSGWTAWYYCYDLRKRNIPKRFNETYSKVIRRGRI